MVKVLTLIRDETHDVQEGSTCGVLPEYMQALGGYFLMKTQYIRIRGKLEMISWAEQFKTGELTLRRTEALAAVKGRDHDNTSSDRSTGGSPWNACACEESEPAKAGR